MLPAAVSLAGLPIPSPAKTAETDPGVEEFAQNARSQHLLHFAEAWTIARVLEREELAAGLVGGRHHRIEVGQVQREGLFGKNVIARLQRCDRPGGVQVAGQGIDDQIDPQVAIG